MTDIEMKTWHPTACILCECNCGIEVLLGEDGKSFAKIRGDKQHPTSQGYTCNKALQLDHYQNGNTDRVTSPLRRRPDGTYEEISWDVAISEVVERLSGIRDTYGGGSIFYYGGGGQGNHLGGAYAPATMAAFGIKYRSSPLAQEKTGEFWVNARMLGDFTRADVEHCEVAVFVGKNPYQSHGFPRARSVLKEIAKDPDRSMVVIDPVRTETAELADFHLQVRPGTDLYLLTALAAVLVQDDVVDHNFIDEHTEGYEDIAAVLSGTDVAEYCAVAGVDEELVRAAAHRIAGAASVAVLEDLGIQMNRDSTVVSYVEKIIWLITGNFAKRGGSYIPTRTSSIGKDRGRSGDQVPLSPVARARVISGLVPCNVIADEILTDHPSRYRAMIVESSNPAHSLADSARMREALRSLDTLVVIDVAMTETARLADYVLPAATQFEKYEATFFNFDFPRNIFHLRRPVVAPPVGVLPEPEIHARLAEAAGILADDDYAPLREAAELGRSQFAQAFLAALADPAKQKCAAVLLYRTLGPTLPDDAGAAAALWAMAQQLVISAPAGVRGAGYGEGPAAGDRLFDAIVAGVHGVVITDEDYGASWGRMGRQRVNLCLPELLEVVASLSDRPRPERSSEFPFVLSAGERRAFTANTIMRDPSWRKRGAGGALRMNPADARLLEVEKGDQVRIITKRATGVVEVEPDPALQPGHVSLPNGFGLGAPGDTPTGAAPNEFTAGEDRDEWVGTPWHKHVPARVERV